MSKMCQATNIEMCVCVYYLSRGLGWRIHESVEDTKLSTNKQHTLSLVCVYETQLNVCVFITAVPITKLFARVCVGGGCVLLQYQCVCLLLQYLLQSCSRGAGGGGWRGEDKCYERLRAEASVN